MNTVMTVTGPVPAQSLGFCQCHEHLAIRRGVSCEVSPVLLIDDGAKSAAEALELVRRGGGTVVDAQPGGCGRMEQVLLQISRETGLNIIASTGFHKLCFYPGQHWLYERDRDELAEIFTNELTQGMYTDTDTEFHPDRCSSRAGIVKMALDKENLSPVYRKLFSAGAAAALVSGAPAMVHIEQDSDPLELFRFLISLGLPPDQMIFCHMDRAVPDLSIHRQLLGEGVFLEYDTIGRFKYHSDQRELAIFQDMLEAGFENQLLFSLDTTRARLKSYDPQAVGLDYLLTTFVPMMLEQGITREQIEKISHHNFVRVFTKNNHGEN